MVGDEHLKLDLIGNGVPFNGIGFSLGHKLDQVKSEQPVDIAFNLESNFFRDVYTMQLKVKDIQ